MEHKGNNGRKILAKVLGIVLVIVLMVTPLLMVSLSLLNADTLTRVLADAVSQELRAAQDRSNPVKYMVEKLPGDMDAERIENVLTDVLGEQPDEKAMEQIMDSDLMAEFVGVYTEDLTNSLSGKQKASQLDAQKLKQITNDNMDEILDIAKDVNPDLTEDDLNKLQSDINQVVEENAEDLLASIPDPGKMKEELTGTVPGMGILLAILEAKAAITAVTIGLIALLAVGIFLCLLQDFRGFRSLSVDLFIGGGFNVLLCVGLFVGASSLPKLISGSVVRSVAGAVLSVLNRGMLLWTGGFLLSAGVLLGAYFVVKKAWAKKHPAVMEET